MAVVPLTVPEFEPLFDNAHLATIAANYWPRKLDTRRFPIRERLYDTDPGVRVLVHEQRPEGRPRGDIVLVHGLEGSSRAGYARSMSQSALESGYAIHRLNLRSCGGTGRLSSTLYHAGLTTDLASVIRRLPGPRLFVFGYSLGGNIVLKLAGELGQEARALLAGVAAISAPIDLAACVRRLGERQNRLYEWNFVRRMKRRLREFGRLDLNGLNRIRTLFEIDDRYTAPAFGFGNAWNYYGTQSAQRWLDRIRVPTLVVQAKDDPLIPWDVYQQPALFANPFVSLVAVERGGHLGFLARRRPRFWLDRLLLDWIAQA